jgi:hypothetical protein
MAPTGNDRGGAVDWMNSAWTHRHTVLARTVQAGAAVFGAVQAYRFGETIGGWPIGVVAALNGAFFCGVLAGAAMARLRPRAGRREDSTD